MMRRSKGFSMVEMMTVVAIFLLLLAISVPGVIAIRNNLEMRQLDDTAREIFVAAQNSLSARKAAGTAELLRVSEENDSGDCWMHQNDPGRADLLPDGSIEGTVAGHDFVIYYNRISGAVIEVYYSEQTDLDALDGSSLSIDYSGNQSARKEDRIGFYSAADSEPGPGTGGSRIALAEPTVTLYNSEDLDKDGVLSAEEDVLALKVSVGKELPGGTHLTITIREKGNDTDDPFTLYDGDSGMVLGGDRQETWTLDGLTDGDQFRNLRDASIALPIRISAGVNIEVTVSLTKAPDLAAEKTYISSAGRAWGNSLYADLEDGTASIATPRHLQNLSSDFSGVNETATTVTAAVQTVAIDWSGAAIEHFTPIDSPVDPLTGLSLLTSYNGNNNVISSLNVSGQGLFSSLTGSDLQDICLLAPTVNSGSDYAAGALIGSATNMTLTHCQVYTDADRPDSGMVSRCQYTGGLVGRAKDCTLTLCSASLPTVTGTDSVGGLAGKLVDTAVEKCYANTGIRSGADGAWEKGLSATGAAGGLAGSLDGGSITDCYVSGFMRTGASSGGGLIGQYLSGTLRRCYSVATLESSAYKGLTGNGAGSSATAYFWSGGAPGDRAAAGSKNLGDIARLSLSGWTAKKTTVPYTRDYCPAPYPYPMIANLTYYGDWPTEVVKDIQVYKNGANVATAEALPYILVQRGTQMTVDAVALKSDGDAALSSVNVELLGDISGDGPASAAVDPDALNVTYHADTGHTSFTLDSSKLGSAGVFGVELTINELRTRIVFVVFDVRVEVVPSLPNGGTESEMQSLKTGLSRFGKEEMVMGQIRLSPSNRYGQFTANISQVSPSLDELKASYAKLESSVPEGTVLLTPFAQTDLEKNWKSIDVADDPTIYENKAGVIDESQAIRKDNVLTVVGKNTGSAFVRAHWAVDPNVYAECRVTMEGARALVKVITLDSSQVGDTYPYRVTLEPSPAEILHLAFIPALFNAPEDAEGQYSYTWNIYRVIPGRDDELMPQYTKSFSGKDWNKDKPYVIALDDDQSEASYRSVLTFHYMDKDGGKEQSSVDETNVSVFRRPAGGDADYDNIRIQEVDYRGAANMKNNVQNVSAEQVTGAGTAFAGCNKTTVSAYTEGVINSQIRWYVYTVGTLDGTERTPNGGAWTRITGTSGSVQVFDENGLERATVKWNPNDAYISVEGESHATGGSVTITGLDTDEYDNTFTFRMKAEAVDVVTGEASASYKLMTARVMPRLKIDPPSKSKAASYGETFFKFAANRTDGAAKDWTYTWSIADTTNLEEAAQSGNTDSISTYRNNPTKYQIKLIHNTVTDANKDYSDHQYQSWKEGSPLPDYEVIAMSPMGVSYMVTRASLLTLHYGPYEATATYESRRRQVNYPIASINQDARITKTETTKDSKGKTTTTISVTDYFLLEKNRSRQLQFSWAEFNGAWYATQKPTEGDESAHATLTYLSGEGKASRVGTSSVTSTELSPQLDGRDQNRAANEAAWTYEVLGNSFSRTATGKDDPLELSWTLDDRSVSSVSATTTWVPCPPDCKDPTHKHTSKLVSSSWGFEYDEVRTITTHVVEKLTYPSPTISLTNSTEKAYSGSQTGSTATSTDRVEEECSTVRENIEKFDEPQWYTCSSKWCKDTHKTTSTTPTETLDTESYLYIKNYKFSYKTSDCKSAKRTTKQSYDETITEYLLNGKPVQHQTSERYEYGYNRQDAVVKYGTGSQPAQPFNGYKLYVVGLDIRSSNSIQNDGNIVESIDLEKPGTEQTLYADGFFPEELRDTKYPVTVKWSTDEPTIVELEGATEQTVSGTALPGITVKAQKYTTSGAYATVTCTYTVTDINGQERTYTSNIPIYVGRVESDKMEVHLMPCDRSDIPALEELYGTDTNTISEIWLNQKLNGDYLMVEDPLFGANVMYLKVTVTDLWNIGTLVPLRDYYVNIFSDAYYITVDTKMLPESSANPGKDTTIYIQLTQVPGHAGSAAIPVDLTLEIGSAKAVTETIQLYRNPDVQIYEDNALVTSKSWPIDWPKEGKQEDMAVSIADMVEAKIYTATLVPTLRDMDGELMDGIVWYLDSPSGYNVSSYLDFTVTSFIAENGKMSSYGGFQFIRSSSIPLIPDFRVVLNAQSSMAYYGEGPGGEDILPGMHQVGTPSVINSDGTRTGSANPLLSTSGYAVVFLPEVR